MNKKAKKIITDIKKAIDKASYINELYADKPCSECPFGCLDENDGLCSCLLDVLEENINYVVNKMNIEGKSPK